MIIGLHHVGRTVTDLATTSAQLAAVTDWSIDVLDSADDALVPGRDVLATARAAGPPGRTGGSSWSRSTGHPGLVER